MAKNILLMHDVIDRFDAMLTELVNDPAFGNVHFVDLRGTLSTDLAGDAYKEWWGNILETRDSAANTPPNCTVEEK